MLQYFGNDILKIIFSFCGEDFFDDILKNKDLFLINIVNRLNIYKEIFLKVECWEFKKCKCGSNFDLTNPAATIYVKRYIYDYLINKNKYEILDNSITQIVPFDNLNYQFICKYYSHRKPKTIILNNKNCNMFYKKNYDDHLGKIFGYQYTLSIDRYVNIFSYGLFPECGIIGMSTTCNCRIKTCYKCRTKYDDTIFDFLNSYF